MSAEVVIVGAVTYDEIHSPAGDVDELLGGSAVHAALGAQFAAQAAPVSVVGDDFDFELLQPLRDAGVSLDGVQQAAWEDVSLGLPIRPERRPTRDSLHAGRRV